MVPKYAFFLSGKGIHTDRLQAFDQALLDAGPLQHNLVAVSSIIPAQCEVISPEEGFKKLTPGEIVFCVLARAETDQAGEHASAAVGVVKEKGEQDIGYISEYHGNAPGEEKTNQVAKRLALEMYMTKMKRVHDSLNLDFHESTAASIKNPGGNKWVCAIALCVFVLPE